MWKLNNNNIFSAFHLQLKSDLDKEDGSLQYILSGEGADSIFFINEHGKIYVRQKLDREKKSFYILRAQVIDRKTHLPIEPDSEFIIKVRDINDHEPQFLDGPYVATVPEMSPEGMACYKLKFYFLIIIISILYSFKILIEYSIDNFSVRRKP